MKVTDRDTVITKLQDRADSYRRKAEQEDSAGHDTMASRLFAKATAMGEAIDIITGSGTE